MPVLLELDFVVGEMFRYEMCEIRGFLHGRLYHALNALTVRKVLSEHFHDGLLLLAHDGVQNSHLGFDIFELGEFCVES